MDGPRALRAQEMGALLELVNNIFTSGRGRMAQAFPTLFCEENLHHSRVIVEDGEPVSHIGMVVRDMILNGCRIPVGNVGVVCTDEAYRKRGYAGAILKDAIRTLREEGVDMLLVSGYRSLYDRHGCTYVGTVEHFEVTHDEATRIASDGTALRLLDPRDLPRWARIYQSEPVRFHRPLEDFEKFTAEGAVHPYLRRERRFYSLWEDGRIAAYVVVLVEEKEQERVARVSEYAGSRSVLSGTLEALLSELRAKRLSLTVPSHDEELSTRLKRAGLTPSLGPTGGTISIIHFARLCARLRPLFEERVGKPVADRLSFEKQDGAYLIALGGKEWILSDVHDVARLIFGAPPGAKPPSPIISENLPQRHREHRELQDPFLRFSLCSPCLRGESEALREALHAIFPIPRPEYGLSYI